MQRYFKDHISIILPLLFVINCLIVIPNFKKIENKFFFSSYALFNLGPQKSLYDLTWFNEDKEIYFLKDVMPQINHSYSHLYSISNKLRNKEYPSPKDIKSMFTFCNCIKLKLININASKSEYMFELKDVTKYIIKEYQVD